MKTWRDLKTPQEKAAYIRSGQAKGLIAPLIAEEVAAAFAAWAELESVKEELKNTKEELETEYWL